MRISIPLITAAAIFAVGLDAEAGVFADGSRPAAVGGSTVHYGDLDIATEQGAKKMLARIERAATKACGGHPTFSTFTGALDNTFKDCRHRAIEKAVTQLAAPTVTRLYSQSKPRES